MKIAVDIPKALHYKFLNDVQKMYPGKKSFEKLFSISSHKYHLHAQDPENIFILLENKEKILFDDFIKLQIESHQDDPEVTIRIDMDNPIAKNNWLGKSVEEIENEIIYNITKYSLLYDIFMSNSKYELVNQANLMLDLFMYHSLSVKNIGNQRLRAVYNQRHLTLVK